ncbi:unnamed protein product [Mytilus edulis]|uniref:ATP-dependent DNA helicase n=1 Tax=Mytilus edulis TaxID=6550 RepID=A0A8S3S629_MYTED|nr:unnamed protein product [Mytilus edulis]
MVRGDAESFKLLIDSVLTDMSKILVKNSDANLCKESRSKLILSIKNMMTDRHIVNQSLKSLLEKMKIECLPTDDDTDMDLIKKMSAINGFKCNLHVLVNFATQAESGLKLWEQNILESVDCSSFFSPSCCDFIRASTKLCVPGADEKSGYGLLFKTFLNQLEPPVDLQLTTFHGHRINLLFSMAGCRALGIVDKLLTGPLWRIIENVDHILDLNDIWLVFKNSIELLSKDASELIEGKVFYPKFTKKDEVFNSLFINNDLDEELNLLTIEALQIILINFLIIIERQLSDCLPGGIFNENTEGVNKDLRVESTTVATTNIVSERDFANLDRLRREKPNANTIALEGIILFSNNKTLRWLDDMNVEKKAEVFKIAREKTPEIIKQFRKRKEEIKKNHMLLLKQRKEEKERKALKKQEEVKALTIEIQKYGGLWLNLKDLNLNLKKSEDKSEAVKTQIKFHKKVLKTNTEDKTLLQFSANSIQFNFEELLSHLKVLINFSSHSKQMGNNENFIIKSARIPTWFATFSAADLRWKETLQVLLEQQKSTQSLEDLDWTGKSELLQYNPVMSAVMIEFQQRGSPHAHCLFWIKDAPLLDTHDDKEVCDFVDSYVTCDLPSESADPELHEIVSSVQQHSKSHSKSCAKKGTECRFNFPRPPSKNTFISRTSTQSGPSVQKPSKQRLVFAKDILLRLWKTVNNTNIENISTQNLFIAAGITQEEFETASNVLTKRTTVTIKRKPADIWINQYNPTLLRCWNANMDLQYITDAYSCVMYIISYISKAEREMGLVLENARKEAAEGNCDAQDAMKKIGGAYFRQREVSAQEATYRACGLHLKESSRKVQFLPVGDNQVKMSLPLNIIQMRANQPDASIWMPSLYDRYKARPVSFQFDMLCYASFSSDYRVLSPSQIPKKPSQYVFELQNDLGYIRKHSRTESAIVAYPRFSKNPELYFKSSLQLFLPHRIDDQLKPLKFKTYQEMYLNGAVSLDSSKEPQQVKTIVESNRHLFEQNADELDEAQDLLEKQGPLEDAWALIAPESEAERLEAQEEKEHLDDEAGSEIPDLDILNKKVRKGTDFEVRQSIFTCQQIQHLLRQLNIEQKRVFYQIRQWCLDKVNGKNPHPFKVFINGGAGTGKSHLIKCLCYETNKILSPHAPNPDDIVVLITAPTATAAFNIGGTTLHQAFSLSKSLPFPYIYKRDDEINKLRTKLQNLQILIIDEISMVGQRVLLYISERLRQIKQSGNALFGNICVIAVGDFYQLPPVKQKCLYDLRPELFFPLWSLNFSLVEINQIMRQKEDSEFAQLLNRLRVKKKTEHLLPRDLSVLKSCMQHSVPLDSLHIFATNKEIDSHNSKMIDKVCEETVTIMA